MPWIEPVAQSRSKNIPPGMQPPEGAANWYEIRASAEGESDSTDVFVFDSIGGFFGIYAEDFIRDLNSITTPKINLRVNSPGGSVHEGVAIANAIRSHPAYVTVHVDGVAASIASVIALAGDKLIMEPQSTLMVHEASTVCCGNAADMEFTRDLLEKMSDNIADAYASKAGGTRQEWRDVMRAETWYLADEAVAAGLADEIGAQKRKTVPAEEEPVEAKMQRTWDLSMYAYAGREQAPAPKIPQQVRLQDGEYVVPGQRVTSTLINGLEPREFSGIDKTPPSPSTDTDKVIVFHGYSSDLVQMIRASVREELALFDGAIGSHSTSVKDGTWDAGANEGRLPSPIPLATARKMYGWYDNDAVEDGAVPKSAAKLPHHFVSEDGTPGAASINGVRNALARLPQTQGLSDAERKTVEAHLRAHLNAYGGDSEDHVHNDPEANADEPVQEGDSPPEPVSAAPPPPDQEEEEEGNEPPPDEGDEPTDEADDWTSVIGLLVSPTSPGADDVFAHLREEW